MLKGAMQQEKTNQRDELSDEKVITVVLRQIKLRKEAILEFTKANRHELAKQNEQEITILEKYLPKQLSKEEVISIIEEAFELIKPTSIKDIGSLMKEISPKLKGKADMGEVNQLIKERLTN